MPIYKTGKSKNGLNQYRVRINYRDAQGRYRQTERTAYGKDAANMIDMQLRAKLGDDNTGTNITVNSLFAEYIDSKKHDVRETSLDKTSRILKAKIIPYMGDVKISKLDNKNLQKWKNDIAELGLSVTTCQNIYGEFRAMLNYAVKMGYISRNPLTPLGNFKDAYFTVPAERIRYYTAAQFKDFIDAAKNNSVTLSDRGYYVFFYIAFFTGMRKGEINALKWSDIEDDVIHVRRSVAQKVKGKDIVETPPKNRASYRDIQIPLPLKAVLEEHKSQQKKSDGFSNDFRVCGGCKCLSDTSIANHNKLFAKAAGLPCIRIHDFRHSHASLLANEGINIQEIARRLGHSNVSMTWNTYSHLYPREEERALDILNKII